MRSKPHVHVTQKNVIKSTFDIKAYCEREKELFFVFLVTSLRVIIQKFRFSFCVIWLQISPAAQFSFEEEEEEEKKKSVKARRKITELL